MRLATPLRVRSAVLAASFSLATALSGFAETAPATAPTAAGGSAASKIEGLWVWQSIYVSDLGEQDKMLDFCQRHGFNRLLIQIPWKKGSAQIVHPKPGDEVQAGSALHPEIAYPVEMARLIATAAGRGIAVEALDGAPYMGDKIHWPETLATVEALLAFNATLPANARFAGVHWDIEPYVRPDWKVQETRNVIEQDYLQLLADAKKKLADAKSAMTLSVDIPMWYDRKTAEGDNCIVAFAGQTKNFHEHIQDICDYVGIMSYRQKAVGRNSTAEVVADEMAYAEKIGKFVCPAFETIELKDTPQITFFGQSGDTFKTQKDLLEQNLQSRSGFGGMFIHHYPSVRALLEPQSAEAK